MAERRKRAASRRQTSRRPVKVRAHTRSPRGSDRGKKRVSVPMHTRRKPRGER